MTDHQLASQDVAENVTTNGAQGASHLDRRYLHEPKEIKVVILGKMGFSSAPQMVWTFLKEGGYQRMNC